MTNEMFASLGVPPQQLFALDHYSPEEAAAHTGLPVEYFWCRDMSREALTEHFCEVSTALDARANLPWASPAAKGFARRVRLHIASQA